VGSGVGRVLVPKRVVDHGVTGSAALPRPQGRTARMLPRGPTYAPDQSVVDSIGLTVGTAGNAAAAATSAAPNDCGCE
jgi:hypothetical protein